MADQSLAGLVSKHEYGDEHWGYWNAGRDSYNSRDTDFCSNGDQP